MFLVNVAHAVLFVQRRLVRLAAMLQAGRSSGAPTRSCPAKLSGRCKDKLSCVVGSAGWLRDGSAPALL